MRAHPLVARGGAPPRGNEVMMIPFLSDALDACGLSTDDLDKEINDMQELEIESKKALVRDLYFLNATLAFVICGVVGVCLLGN